MSFPFYRQYKLSGVEGLGDIPEHWEVKPLKAICTHNDEVLGENTSADLQFEYIEISDVQAGRGVVSRSVVKFSDAPSRARRIVRNGDVLVSTVRTYLRAIAPIVEAADSLIASTGFAVLRPHGVNPRFLGYLCQTEFFIDGLIARSVGVSYPAINASELVGLDVPLPPAEEQEAIASFLDQETARIDALVGEQQRLLELLKEKRQAVITQAVTKGLEPSIPMKSSHIEWLGDVPAHWSVTSLKRMFKSVDYGISESLEPEGMIAILRMGNIANGKVLLDDLKYVDHVDPALLLRENDLLFNRTNSLDLIGKVGRFTAVDYPMSFASYLVRIRLVEGCSATYFSYLLNTTGILGVARSSAFVAIGQCNLNPTRYGQIAVAVPPSEEQWAIAGYLDRHTKALDELIDHGERAITLLLERRLALISAAVTGKIDIRKPVDPAASASRLEVCA